MNRIITNRLLTLYMRVCLLGFSFFYSIPSLADHQDYFSEEATGWYWHDIKPEKTEIEESESSTQSTNPVEQLKNIQQQIETAKAKAVLSPTKENVGDYIRLQNQLGEQAAKFEGAWKAVLLEQPQLDYSLKHPTNNLAKRVELDREKGEEEAVIKELAKKSGLFFFYRSSCPYCVKFAPILKDFADKYGIPVIPITTDGIALPEFPQSVTDHGQAAKFKVTVEPALFSVNPYTHQAFPVAYGLTSQADLKRRLLEVARQFKRS